jgi:hypothetical protein
MEFKAEGAAEAGSGGFGEGIAAAALAGGGEGCFLCAIIPPTYYYYRTPTATRRVLSNIL